MDYRVFVRPECVPEMVADLLKHGLGGRIPAYLGAAQGHFLLAENRRDTTIPENGLALRTGLAVIVLDNDGSSTGPESWPQARQLLRWARSTVVAVGAGTDSCPYDILVHGCVRRRRSLLIETDTAHVDSWAAEMLANARRDAWQTIATPMGFARPSL